VPASQSVTFIVPKMLIKLCIHSCSFTWRRVFGTILNGRSVTLTEHQTLTSGCLRRNLFEFFHRLQTQGYIHPLMTITSLMTALVGQEK